jgi:hypothetical protein
MDEYDLLQRARYAGVTMRGKRGPGPWGKAIEYWLAHHGWSQADLVRRIWQQEHTPPPLPHDPTAKQPRRRRRIRAMQLNTVSRAARGLHTQTALLERIAKGLGVPFADVLVSPESRRTIDDRHQFITDLTAAFTRALRQLETLPRRVPASRETMPALGEVEAKFRDAVERLDELERTRRERTRSNHDMLPSKESAVSKKSRKNA